MKKQLLFIATLIILAGGYYLATPKQTRLGDDYQPENITIQEEDFVVAPDTKTKVEKIALYYYDATDATCQNPIAVYLPDMDTRYEYQEINSVITLLNNDKVPHGYKTPFIPGTVLNQLRISKGVAYVDLSTFLTLGSGPCESTARQKLILQTLSQFEDVKEIKLLVDGVELIPTL
ncbi:GerMN domain-containing protein [Candidatus Falkowbacteria bacterium]|nr:GerMN domain-containing protein [Candidatus Falkowbacteria bacterium]